MVAAERITEHEAVVRLKARSFGGLKKTHKDLYDQACKDFGLDCPAGIAPVPARLSARATMKLAAIYVNLGYSDPYVCNVLGFDRSWLHRIAGKEHGFPTYWEWLKRQSPSLPQGHVPRIWIYDEKTGHLIGHSRHGNWRTITKARRKRLRAYLESLGLPVHATEEEERVFHSKLSGDQRNQADRLQKRRMLEHLEKHQLLRLDKGQEPETNLRKAPGKKRKGGRPRSPACPILKRLYAEDPKMDRATMADLVNRQLGASYMTADRVRALLGRMLRAGELS